MKFQFGRSTNPTHEIMNIAMKPNTSPKGMPLAQPAPSNQEPEPKDDRTYLNFITLSAIIQKSMIDQAGSLDIDYDLGEIVAWSIARRLPSGFLIPLQKKVTIKDVLKFAEQKDNAMLNRKDRVIPEDTRRGMRQNIENCKDEGLEFDHDELKDVYARHVEMLLNEVERLELGMDRLAEEYIREKWTLLDTNRALKEAIADNGVRIPKKTRITNNTQ